MPIIWPPRLEHLPPLPTLQGYYLQLYPIIKGFFTLPSASCPISSLDREEAVLGIGGMCAVTDSRSLCELWSTISPLSFPSSAPRIPGAQQRASCNISSHVCEAPQWPACTYLSDPQSWCGCRLYHPLLLRRAILPHNYYDLAHGLWRSVCPGFCIPPSSVWGT